MSTQRRHVIGELDSFVSGLVKKVVTVTARTLEEDTPELTGFAQSNWLATLGAPREAPTGSRSNVDFIAVETSIALIEATYTIPTKVYISNPVDYISSLNSGSSAKAPANFVQTAIAKSIRSII